MSKRHANIRSLAGVPEEVRQVISVEATRFGILPVDIRGVRHVRRYVDARKSVARRLRAQGYSLPSIGRFLGGMHHTTVKYYLDGGELQSSVKMSIPDFSVPDFSGEWAI